MAIDVLKHELVPKHEVLPNKETKKLLEKLAIEKKSLPKVFIADPAIKSIEAKVGDVIKITRKSPTAGTAIYYRVVVDA